MSKVFDSNILIYHLNDKLDEAAQIMMEQAIEAGAFVSVVTRIEILGWPGQMTSTRWDLIVFDEAHHLIRTRAGGKVNATQNYRLAETLRGRTRDLLFLSATPHQGDPFQFWSLIQLLDDSLFDSPEAMLDHRGLLNRAMIRRIKREVTDAEGQPIFMRRQVHSQVFAMAHRERAFYDRLAEYLREGYGAAGVGETRTTSSQRAIGFVMATFHLKIADLKPDGAWASVKDGAEASVLTLLVTGISTPALNDQP